ncbi:hypothetical protein [Desulfovibrio inopinatus]|nr:hypothetical protein [Desulfovibrio inopinatus]
MIRKHGLCATASTIESMLADPATAIRRNGDVSGRIMNGPRAKAAGLAKE